MWTNANRVDYDRGYLRYPSDLTDAEWWLVGPLIPPASTTVAFVDICSVSMRL